MGLNIDFLLVGRAPTPGNNFYMQIKAAINKKSIFDYNIKSICHRAMNEVSLPMFLASNYHMRQNLGVKNLFCANYGGHYQKIDFRPQDQYYKS